MIPYILQAILSWPNGAEFWNIVTFVRGKESRVVDHLKIKNQLDLLIIKKILFLDGNGYRLRLDLETE